MSNNSPVVPSPVVSPAAVPNPADVVAKLMAELEALKAQLTEANKRADAPRSISLKVSEKGALSLYGMGRFPVTLYKEQWRTILSKAADVEAFIVANESRLKAKEDESEEQRKARVAAYSATAATKHAVSQGNAYKPGDGQNGHKAV